MVNAIASKPQAVYIKNMDSHLTALNPMQRKAVEQLDGPVLVLAGAGTGKTRVLTARLAHLLISGKATPHQILAVTFTNKAAGEMRERVAKYVGSPVEGWWIGTFHSIAARILRRHAPLLDLKPTFTILGDDDQERLLKQIMQGRDIDTKKTPPRMVVDTISRWKDRVMTPGDLGPGDASDIADGKMREIYREYQERLKTLNACDFGDLILHCITLLRNQPDILAQYQRHFRYILVDEYQDTNLAQYLWLRLLAQGHQNICCVGDDDQSIYGWRGAEVGNILRFEEDYPGAEVIRLEENYRSTGHILGAASGLIAHNRGRLGKTLWAASHQDGEKIAVMSLWRGDEEVRFIADEMEKRRRTGDPWSRMAILLRTGYQTRAFEEHFLSRGIPHRVIGGMRFFERQEIRDAIAYLRVIAQPDDDMALLRIINLPKRGLGNTTVDDILQAARSSGQSLTQAIARLLGTDALRPKVKTTLASLMDDFARWRQLGAETTHLRLAETVLEESGYLAMWRAEKSPEAQGRLENLRELVSGAMAEFEDLPAFLEHVSLVMDTESRKGEDAASIMTLHGAKGLEFDTVFLPGWEEGLFPGQRTLDENGSAGLEEERRLAYVGITRARKRAFISHAGERYLFGSLTTPLPSRFLAELPEEHVSRKMSSFSPPRFGGYGERQKPEKPAQPKWSREWRERQNAAPAERPPAPKTISLRESEGGFGLGERVFHQKFGYGKVIGMDHDRLDISFEHAGRKKVLDSFVIPADEVGEGMFT
ncbi:MAG TPA: DNA helicase II [Rhodospirillaceae bacterium]|nr:DNA helicase II [Rhodospirillaceae bacterium]